MSRRTPDRTPDVRFVVAPFLPEHCPSLGVSSLLAVLEARGLDADIVYLNLSYRQRIGRHLYEFVARQVPGEFLLGEMVFARALWGEQSPTWDDYAERLRRHIPDFAHLMLLHSGIDEGEAVAATRRSWADIEEALRELHYRAPEMVDAWADELLECEPPIIGLTSTFQQNLASLALARELRRRLPRERLAILMGGANCEADMGAALAENFEFVDHVVSGEAEEVIVDLVEGILAGSGSPPRYVVGPMVRDLDSLPAPVFDHYFDAVRGTELDERANLVAESSRGCWWGMKHHCTFCGLNGTTMAFRSKDPRRFADEIRDLTRAYGDRHFMMADNILDLSYIKKLLPGLVARDQRSLFFYETKSNLRKEQLEMMAAGGVFKLQPGIESLSTPILQLMDKGTTRLQNLQLLKWGEEFRQIVLWYLLYGFPGEPAGEYDEMAALVPLLVHLRPPVTATRIRLDRFGPYWTNPGKYGIDNVRRFWSYDVAYAGLAPEQRDRIAYFFEYDHADGRDPRGYAAPALEALTHWTNAYRRGATLEVVAVEGGWQVIDSRHAEDAEVYPLETAARRLLTVLDTATSRAAARARLEQTAGAVAGMDIGEFDRMVDGFLEHGWVIEESGRLLSLVLDRSEHERIPRLRLALQLEHLGLPQPEVVHAPVPRA